MRAEGTQRGGLQQRVREGVLEEMVLQGVTEGWEVLRVVEIQGNGIPGRGFLERERQGVGGSNGTCGQPLPKSSLTSLLQPRSVSGFHTLPVLIAFLRPLVSSARCN